MKFNYFLTKVLLVLTIVSIPLNLFTFFVGRLTQDPKLANQGLFFAITSGVMLAFLYYNREPRS